MRWIGIDELDAVIAEKSPVIVDLRTPLEYERGHLPGAVNVPVDSDLLEIPSVAEVSDLHIWQAGANRKLLSAHLKSSEYTPNHEAIIRAVQEVLAHKYGINHTTLQILLSSAGEMDHCNHCN
jgi:cobalt-zinc-cadmium efflux system protein